MITNVTTLQYIFFGLCGISGIVILIFILRKYEDNIDYNKIINMLNEEQKKDLETLNKGNKKIDKLESEILKYKKKLGMKLFNK